MTDRVSRETTDLAFQSYGRCCSNDAFFEDFYNIFMSKSGEVRAMFANTDMAEQRRLVRAGLMWLIMYARGSQGSKIEHLARTHDRHHMNVDPAWYTVWVDSLMETVARHDPEFDRPLEQAWRATLSPGIEAMKQGY